jgi:peptidoglycan hydrolase-like protein with peptidoglycan-binding domain
MVLGIATEFQTGSSGTDVKQIQAALAFGGYLQTAPDGLYGPLTKQAVQRFQSDKGLAIDGIVGPNTWAALMGGSMASAPAPAVITLPARSIPTTLPVMGTFPALSGLSPMQMILGGLGVLVAVTMGIGKGGKGTSKRKRKRKR